MGATVFYQGANEIAVLANTFSVSGTPTDPTTVSCVITDPTGVATTHTYLAASPADITKTGTGVFELDVPCTIVGLWGFVWIGTGTASDVQAGTWTVHPSSTRNQFYTSVAELKDRLSITDTASDFQLEVAVQAAARAVEEYTGRFFYQVTEARTFQPYSIYQLPIDDLVSVTSFAVDQNADGVFEDTWALSTDYQLMIGMDEFNQSSTGEQRPFTEVWALGSKSFPPVTPYSRLNLIQITGNWGWPQVPFAVKQATMQVAAELFKLKDAPFGLAGTSEIGVMRLPRAGNPYVNRLLCRYINPRRKIGV